MSARTPGATREAPIGGVDRQPEPREGQAGPVGVAERPVVPRKSGNAGGGKGPQLGLNVRRGQGPEIGVSLATPIRVQALRVAEQ
jgi:hypothetical protein